HQGYSYPVHVDEWVHLTYSEAMLQAGDTGFLDPFWGQTAASISSNLEAGFHLFWGIFHQISGISWLTIYRYFPSVIFMITVLSAYVLGRRQGFGWEAAFFTALMPTTVGVLGPGFMVPVAMGLLFIPLALFLIFNFRSVWSYVVLFIFTSFLLSIHAPSAICVVIVLAPYLILTLKDDFKHSLFAGLAMIIPFLAPFPWIFKLLLPTAQALFTPQPFPMYIDFPRVVQTYGYLPIAFCLLGTLFLALKVRGEEGDDGLIKENYGLILGFLALLVMLMTFFTFHYGISIMYERGLMFMMLMVGVVAGAGLALVKNLSLPARLTGWVKLPVIAQSVGKFLCLAFIGLTLFFAIPDRQETPYYSMIEDEDYQAFVWVRDNLGENYGKAILDPWKATAFTAITGKNIYTRSHAFPMPIDEEAALFLDEGCTDTAFLKENGISIIYNQVECQNPDLFEVRENIYILEESTSP
ncbi:hypothetical protein ACFLW9_03660, partial [Chloroflexota bacterium]